MADSTFSLKGDKELARKLKRLEQESADHVGRALRVEGERIMTRSKRDFVPVDLGTLRSSGTVSGPTRKGKDLTIDLSYGGAAAAYALAVHEHPSGSSPRSWEGATVTFSPSGRGPKYLERPLMEAIPGLPQRLAAALVSELEKLRE